MKNHPSRRNSGQVLIIVALLVTLLLLSTAIYIIETEKDARLYERGMYTNFSEYKMGATHTIISALANVSNGGTEDILTTNLSKFKSIIDNHTFNTFLGMNATPLSAAPYQNGFWISWGSSGKGVTSAYVNFILNSSGNSVAHYSEFAVNVTSEIDVNGEYTLLTGATKQANLTCTLFNEGNSALAQNFTVYTEFDGSFSTEEWIKVASPDITDYGNGTYRISFTAETQDQNNPLLVSVQVHDLRYVFLRANVTCVQN